ncbi:MAG: F0F1 ATP synthase subunit epsilon [Alphaproteobacteria bacterium]|nr:F0F1 ATP synthase subunit epsilon [Alphaproteobacteria bacterium]
MAEKIDFELISPERLLVSQAVEMVVVPGSEGDFGALPRHAPMITAVRPGVIEVYDASVLRDRIFVAGGFAEVSEKRITVLAEEAVMVGDLTAAMVEQRAKKAREALDEAPNEVARAAARQSLAIAEAMRAALPTKTTGH